LFIQLAKHSLKSGIQLAPNLYIFMELKNLSMRLKTIFLACCLILISGCKSKKEGDTEAFSNFSLFDDYVLEVSHGIISTQDEVRVVLTNPVSSWKEGSTLDSDLLVVSPRVKGKVVVLDPRTLTFVPEDGFKQDTSYEFTLDLEAIIKDVPENLENFVFGVKTLKQQFNVYTNALQSHSKDLQYVEGQIRSADQLTLAEAKKILKVKQGGKTIPVTFDTSVKQGTQFQFKIDSIQRFKEDSEIEVEWDGAAFNIDSKGKNTIKIPGKNNFIILNIKISEEAKQMLSINFSDPLKKNQNFKGLVVLEGDANPKFSVSGNTLKVYPGKEITGTVQLEVFEGIQSSEGYKLKTKYQERVAFEQLKPEVKMLSNGTLLPSSSNLKINFEAVNLNAIDVTVLKIYENNVLQFLQTNNLNGSNSMTRVARPVARQKIALQNKLSSDNSKWKAHALDLKSLITPEPGAIYRVELSYKPSYSSFKCDETNFEPEEETETSYDDETESSSWDGAEEYYNDYYYDYDWNERENPCNTSYYYNKSVAINVLASDLGLTVKMGANKNYFVAVNDILNTNPVAGAKITFYNYQQQAIGNVVTKADGTAFYKAPDLAFFAVAENNGQKTYVKLNDGNSLSVSKFNVSGVELKRGIKGFIFGERGVWRPGDQIFLSFMLNDKANPLPQNHPVKLELLDPYNKTVIREIKTNGLNNFYHFKIKTDENAPTGNWLAKVSVGGASFTKTIKIETVKPNRLKIKTDFEGEVLSGRKPIQGNLEVKWLHGAIAKNLKADITAKFNPTATSFKTFPGYVFDDPTRSFSSEDQVVFNGQVNQEGKANFTINPQLDGKAPGMLIYQTLLAL